MTRPLSRKRLCLSRDPAGTRTALRNEHAVSVACNRNRRIIESPASSIAYRHVDAHVQQQVRYAEQRILLRNRFAALITNANPRLIESPLTFTLLNIEKSTRSQNVSFTSSKQFRFCVTSRKVRTTRKINSALLTSRSRFAYESNKRSGKERRRVILSYTESEEE